MSKERVVNRYITMDARKDSLIDMQAEELNKVNAVIRAMRKAVIDGNKELAIGLADNQIKSLRYKRD